MRSPPAGQNALSPSTSAWKRWITRAMSFSLPSTWYSSGWPVKLSATSRRSSPSVRVKA